MPKKVKIKNKTHTMVKQKLALVIVIAALFLIVRAFAIFVIKSTSETSDEFTLDKPTVTDNIQPIPEVQSLAYCDHNYDGVVNISDVALFSHCQTTFDADDDGDHDLADASLYASNYQDTKWCKRWVPECEATEEDHSDFFGLQINMSSEAELQYSLGIMDDLNIDKTRVWENWILREPQSGEFNWAGLDMRINGLYDNGKTFVLTIKPVGILNGSTSWYCQADKANENSCVFNPEYEDDFGLYVEEIVKRYPGKIDIIEFSNEWDSDWQFVGDAQDYTKYANILYNAVKKYSPSTKVSLGPITKWPLVYVAGCRLNIIDEFYTQQGELVTPAQKQAWCASDEAVQKNSRVEYVLANANYDLLDVHLYDDPENWDKYLTAYQYILDELDLAQKPIIATEFGGPNNFDTRFDASDELFQAAEMQRYLDKLATLPIQTAYYFKMVEGADSAPHHLYTGIMKLEEGATYPIEKPNYDVFKNFIHQQ